MRLLIVDDDKIEREALKQFFNKNKDLEVEVVGEAINGLEAIKLNQDLKPDLILMDICLGILDGLKATEIIRKHSPHVEIIILTAFRSFEYSRQAIKNRVFDYLLKPVKEKELIASIEKVKKHIMLQKQILNDAKTNKLFDYWLTQRQEGQKYKYKVFEDKRVTTVINYIMDNLDKDLNLEHLASLVYINASYLSRLFKSTTGVSISNFIHEARIEKAKFLLITEHNKPIKEISEEVGFTNIHHFYNTFKKLEGTTPATFRTLKKRIV